jgi:outer membrane protein, heavy metal efflux system
LFGKIIIFLLMISASISGITSLLAEPLTINEAVRLTLKTHPDVKIASALIEEAKGNRMSELSLSSPGLAIEYEGIPDGEGFSEYEERRIAISQEFEFPLRYIWLSRSANIEVELARLESRSLLLDLEARIRQTYFDTWIQIRSNEILTEISLGAESYAQKIERQFELGEASRLDAKRARLEALEVKGQLKNAIRSVATAKLKLASLTGYDVSDVELVFSLDDNQIDTDRIGRALLDLKSTSNQVIKEPIADNPETAFIQAELELAGTAKTLSRTAWLPELEFSYFQQTVPDDDSEFWGVELGFNLPVWFWWGGRGDMKVAEAHEKNIKEQLAANQIDVLSEWQEIAQNLVSAVERYDLYKHDILPLSQETYELSIRSFDVGEADYFEVIDAQRNLLDVQLDFLETTGDVYSNQIEIDRLEGRSILDYENKGNEGDTRRKP